MFWRNTYFQVTLAFILFILAGFYFPVIEHDSDFLNIILSMATFTFAIVLAFSISRRHSRLSSLRHLLRSNDATMIDIYQMSKCFDKVTQKKILKLIDNYMILQLDYYLEDFNRSLPGLIKLQEYIFALNAKTNKQAEVQSHMIDASEVLTGRQKEIEFLVQDKMLAYEWGSLLILTVIIWFALLIVNDKSYISTLLIASLGSSFVVFLGLLQDLNNFTWQQPQWIWQPLSSLFLTLGLKPYFPEDVIKEGRVKKPYLNQLKAYRIAHYPNPYPDNTGKKIKIIKNK